MSEHQIKDWKQEIANDIETFEFTLWEKFRYSLFRLITKGMGALSPKGLDSIARALGFLLWHGLPSRKKLAIQALKQHLNLSEEEATRIARASFTENCRSFLEIFHVGVYDDNRLAKVTPEEIEKQFRAETQPIVVATAHIGSWEVMAAMVQEFHPDRYKMVVVRLQKDKPLARIMLELRSSRGMLAVGHRQAAGKVRDALKKSGIAAFLVDHNCSRKEAVFLPFLGEIAAVNSGPAMLALRSKAVVYPMFNIRQPGGKHLMHVYPPLRTTELSGTIAERVEQIARYYTDCVADIVTKYPEQWFWMHARWKTRPLAETASN